MTLVESTSPNSLLLGSLDAARRHAAPQGRELLAETMRGARETREAIRAIDGPRRARRAARRAPGRARLRPAAAGGRRARHRAAAATSSPGCCASSDDINLELCGRERDRGACSGWARRAPSTRRAPGRRRCAARRASSARRGRTRGEPFAPPPPWGELEMTPREAFLGPQEVVPVERGGRAGSRPSRWPPTRRGSRTCCPASGSPPTIGVHPGRIARARRRRCAARATARCGRSAWWSSDDASPRYGPPDASQAPRYTGIRTFARCPLRATSPAGVDVGGGRASRSTPRPAYRPGARFGPEAIRAGLDRCCGPWHPALDVDVFAALLGRRPAATSTITPGNAERTAGQIADGARAACCAPASTPLVLGGDHSIVLGELRAHAARARAAGAGAARRPRGHLGPVLRRALLPRHAVPAGAGGGPARARALGAGRDARPALRGLRPRRARARWASRSSPATSCARWTPADYARRVRDARRRGAGVLQLRHRRDRPGVRAGDRHARGRGPAAARGARAHPRRCAGMRFSGFDVVEVSPPYDTPGQVTALLAATIAYEFLALTALAGGVRAVARRRPQPFWWKWRYYERNERFWRKPRLRRHMLTGSGIVRFPSWEISSRPSTRDAAEIEPWVLVEAGCWFALYPETATMRSARARS